MINHYELHSLSKLYREEALREARVRHLEHRAKAHRRVCSEEQVGWFYWLGKLASAVESS